MSSPADEATEQRMRTAHRLAASMLAASGAEVLVWGYQGRTVSGPTTSGRWLRVLAVPAGQEHGNLWYGPATADRLLPATVPRPTLLDVTSWSGDGYTYRAELTTMAPAPVCSPTPCLSGGAPLLGEVWWHHLREALTTLEAAALPLERNPVISQDWLNRSLPKFLGPLAEGVDPLPPAGWTLAHGDLHWANVTQTPLCLLDWEGFGPAPRGFDAANLHAYSLPCPAVAERVRAEFAGILDTEHGRFAQLAVAAIIVQTGERDPLHARLAVPVLAHLEGVLSTS